MGSKFLVGYVSGMLTLTALVTAFGSGNSIKGLYSADVNGDGIQDTVIEYENGKTGFYLGQQDGTCTKASGTDELMERLLREWKQKRQELKGAEE